MIILFPKPFQWNSLDLMGMSSQRMAFFVPWMAPPVGQCFKRDRPRTPAVPGPAAFRTAAHHQRPPSSPSSHFIPETLQKLPTDHQKGPFHYTKKNPEKVNKDFFLETGEWVEPSQQRPSVGTTPRGPCRTCSRSLRVCLCGSSGRWR